MDVKATVHEGSSVEVRVTRIGATTESQQVAFHMESGTAQGTECF